MSGVTSRMVRWIARQVVEDLAEALKAPAPGVLPVERPEGDTEEIIAELRDEVLELRRLLKEARAQANPQVIAERNAAIEMRDQLLREKTNWLAAQRAPRPRKRPTRRAGKVRRKGRE